MPGGLHAAGSWDALIEWDPEELRANRVKEIAYLARYGRQSMLQWEHVPVSVLDDYFEALSDIIKAEHDPTRSMTEDH